jgi:hypothetical protein
LTYQIILLFRRKIRDGRKIQIGEGKEIPYIDRLDEEEDETGTLHSF